MAKARLKLLTSYIFAGQVVFNQAIFSFEKPNFLKNS
jgi:hypothetical protein